MSIQEHVASSATADLRAELARLFRRPWTELTILLINAVIVIVGWLVLPANVKEWLFDSLQGRLAFVIVLETWLVSDVSSTNIFGHDPAAALRALQEGRALRRFVRIKAAALSVLIGVPCTITALILGIHGGSMGRAAILAPMFLAIPFGVIAIGSWLGVVLPYRYRTLRWRWQNRHLWRVTVRWLIAMMVPYWILGVFVPITIYLARLTAGLITNLHRHVRAPASTMGLTVIVACAVAALTLFLAPWVTERLARWRRDHLVAELGIAVPE